MLGPLTCLRTTVQQLVVVRYLPRIERVKRWFTWTMSCLDWYREILLMAQEGLTFNHHRPANPQVDR